METDTAVDDAVTEPSDVHPLDVVNLNQNAAFKYLEGLGYPVTRWMIKCAFDSKEVRPARLGTGNYVSRRDMLNWVESRRQDGPYRASKSVAADTDQ